MQPHQWNEQALLEHFLAQPGAPASADVDVVHAVDRIADHPVAMERRCEDEDVGGLTVAHPRIVADKHVTWTRHLGWEGVAQLLADHTNDPDVAGGTKPSLADQIAAVVIEPRRHVVYFDHVVRKRCTKQGGRHFVSSRDQARPDGIEIEARHLSLRRIKVDIERTVAIHRYPRTGIDHSGRRILLDQAGACELHVALQQFAAIDSEWNEAALPGGIGAAPAARSSASIGVRYRQLGQRIDLGAGETANVHRHQLDRHIVVEVTVFAAIDTCERLEQLVRREHGDAIGYYAHRH